MASHPRKQYCSQTENLKAHKPLYALYSSPNITRVIISNRVLWMGKIDAW
jgi:hypothetical protein